jgi:hypothetical protein
MTLDYALVFDVELPRTGYGFFVTVGAPWKIGAFNTTPSFCWTPPAADNCSYYPNGRFFIQVFTDDPNAPARNILIQEATTSHPCP